MTTNTILIIFCSVLLKTRNFTDKSCRENQNTYFMFSNFFFQELCHLYDNVEKYCRAGQAKDNVVHTHIASWITKDINTRSEYIILTAFQLQQLLHESASLLHYTYIACLIWRYKSQILFQYMNVKASKVHKIPLHTYGMYTQHISLKYTFPLFHSNTRMF